MHTLQLEIDDSIFDKFMGFLEILPKEKISIVKDDNTNTISFEKAKEKVQRAINDISKNEGIEVNEAFNRILNS